VVDDNLATELRSYRNLRALQQFPVTTPYEFSYSHDSTGRFIHLCKHASEEFGIPAEHTSEYSIFDIFDDVYARELAREAKAEFRAVTFKTLNVFLARNARGQPLRLEVEATRAKSPNGDFIKGRARLLSPLLLEALGRYGRVVEGGHVAGWDRNVTLGQFFASKEWKTQLGLGSNDVISFDGFIDRIDSRDKDLVTTAIRNNETGKGYDVEYRVHTINGQVSVVLH